MRGEPVAENLLRVAVRVEVGGVDEVAAEIEVCLENLLGLLDAAAGAARVFAEGHRAEGKRADPQPGPAECDVLIEWQLRRRWSPRYSARQPLHQVVTSTTSRAYPSVRERRMVQLRAALSLLREITDPYA